MVLGLKPDHHRWIEESSVGPCMDMSLAVEMHVKTLTFTFTSIMDGSLPNFQYISTASQNSSDFNIEKKQMQTASAVSENTTVSKNISET